MANLTTEGHQVYTVLDEFGRRKINGLLENGIIVISVGVVIKEVLDAIGLSDAALTDKTFIITDSLGLTDATPLTDKTLPISDVLGLSDALLLDKNLLIMDSVTLAESLLLDKLIIISDPIQLTDQILIDKLLTITDSLGLTDTVALITAWPGVVMVLNLKSRTLQLAVLERKLTLDIKKREQGLVIK